MSNFIYLLAYYIKKGYHQNREGDYMIYPSIDKLLNQVGSKYLLVNLVSKRAQEIKETNHLQMKETDYKSKKEIGRALEEVANNKIHLKETL